MARATRILLALIATLIVVLIVGLLEARRMFRYQAVDPVNGVVFDRQRGVFCHPQGCTRVRELPFLRYSAWRDALGKDSLYSPIADCEYPANPYRDPRRPVCPPGVIPARAR